MSLYTSLEIAIIFKNIETVEEFEKIIKTFEWLIDYGFQKPSAFLHSVSLHTYNKFYNLN